MDILSDILRAHRLHGTVYFRADFRQPWGMAIQGGSFAGFHIVAAGRCWARVREEQPFQLNTGDVVMFPHGSAHALLGAPDAQVKPASEVIGATSASDDLIAVGTGGANSGAADRPVFGGGGSVTTTLICGHFEIDRVRMHPLLGALPEVVHVRHDAESGPAWLTTAGELAAAQAGAGRAGAGALVDRLAETLLVQTLIAYSEGLSDQDEAHFLAAIQDRGIGRVLACLHREPARDWSLDELAAMSAMSRSALTERFRALVGVSPIVYLARWRMLKARELLRESRVSVASIAQSVGYQSEFAFSKAYKRHFGKSPNQMRSDGGIGR